AVRLLFQVLCGALEPVGRPFACLDAVAEHRQRAGVRLRVGPPVRVAGLLDGLGDPAKLLRLDPRDRCALASDLGCSLRIDRAGEEELQQALVTGLEHLGRTGDPLASGPLALGCEPEGGALACASRGVVSHDQPGLLELLQLWIDLPVARGPEEAGRAVDELLDLVTGAW